MSKRIQIILLTPFFLVFATLSCLLFAELDKQHKESLVLTQVAEQEQMIAELDNECLEALHEVVAALSRTSRIRFAWNKTFVTHLNRLSAEDVRGFDLLSAFLHSEELLNQWPQMKEQRRNYETFVALVRDALLREYESPHFFQRARRFAQRFSLSEDGVIKRVQDGVEGIKFDHSLSAIEAFLDYLTLQREATHCASYSVL